MVTMRATITVSIPKRHNEVWAGTGKVTSGDISDGVVIVEMLTGQMAGSIGGFQVDKVKFTKVIRATDGSTIPAEAATNEMR